MQREQFSSTQQIQGTKHPALDAPRAGRWGRGGLWEHSPCPWQDKGQQRATGTSHVLRKSEEFSVNGNLGHPLSLHVILREFLFCGVQASARLTLSPCLGSAAQLLLPRCSQSYLHCSTSLTLYLCNWSSRRQWELCNQLPTSQVLGTGLVTLIMHLLGHTE